MEAATLKNKKSNKSKIKKNIKNVLCRPDPVHWPVVADEEGQKLVLMLAKHKIDTPVFNKLHWKDLKLIPKDQRPKPPKLKKVDGLFLGITEVSNAINTGQCSAVILEAAINPRMIVQHVTDACSNKNIPLVCLNGLRKTSQTYFGVPTSCLGVKNDTFSKVADLITELAKNHTKPLKSVNTIEKMDTEETITDNITAKQPINPVNILYLYRTSKKTRVFVPNSENADIKVPKKFVGQDFIEFPKGEDNSNYKKMVVKRISNNADRVKKK